MSSGICHRVPDRLSIGQKQEQQHHLHATGSDAHMTLSCPRCHTSFVVPRRRAQTTVAALGGIVGAIRGASTALSGTDRRGSSQPLGVIAGAILGGLLGGAAGCAAGAAVGTPIDQALPDNFRCEACGHVFDAHRVDPSLT